MYHDIVRAVIRRSFAHLSRADFEAVLKNFSPNVVFSFAGDHAVGGERRGRDAVRTWFWRLHELFPGLQITPTRTLVSGWPWNTLAVTFFQVREILPHGQAYHNEGQQLLRLR